MNVNAPFSVLADHDGANVESFRLYVNGELVQEKPVTALASGVISFADADGLPKGSYTVEVSAVNAEGEAKSEPVTLVVTGIPPVAPVNVRFTVL